MDLNRNMLSITLYFNTTSLSPSLSLFYPSPWPLSQCDHIDVDTLVCVIACIFLLLTCSVWTLSKHHTPLLSKDILRVLAISALLIDTNNEN